MTKAHRLKTRKPKALTESFVPLHFLLGCSDRSLGEFELARLAEVADLRRELHAILDRLIDGMAQAGIAAWFRTVDRNDIRRALETPDDAIDEIILRAQEEIRTKGRSKEEQEADLIPRASLPPGASHLAAALRYQQRNIAEGKCSVCPKPLARNSVRFCEEHLAKQRGRDQQKKGLSLPGGREYLYSGEVTPSSHGRQPGTLASLEMNREKKTRAVLAELGIPPESAAVSLKAAIEALLRVMPDSKAKAMTAYDLFQAAQIPTSAGRRSTTGYRALLELQKAGKIQRIGESKPGSPFRYLTLYGLSE